jgi:hypothetical protein
MLDTDADWADLELRVAVVGRQQREGSVFVNQTRGCAVGEEPTCSVSDASFGRANAAAAA